MKQISIELNVSAPTIRSIVIGKSYKDIVNTVTELTIKGEDVL